MDLSRAVSQEILVRLLSDCVTLTSRHLRDNDPNAVF
jgi:hypothetical protein